MTTSIQRAETELRSAALAYAQAEKAYHAACDVERKRLGDRWADCNISVYSAEWHEVAKKLNAIRATMEHCASALDAALDAEHRAEAL